MPTSSSARIIPLDLTPRSFASPSVEPSGITAPGSATATVWPAATLGAPQTIVCGPPCRHVDQADGEPVGVRVPLGLEHAADHERGRVAHAHPMEPLELVAGHRQAVGDLLGAQAGVAVGAQPANGTLMAGSELLEQRTSLSNSMRRSGTSWTSIAMRSIPMPQAKPWTRSLS